MMVTVILDLQQQAVFSRRRVLRKGLKTNCTEELVIRKCNPKIVTPLQVTGLIDFRRSPTSWRLHIIVDVSPLNQNINHRSCEFIEKPWALYYHYRSSLCRVWGQYVSPLSDYQILINLCEQLVTFGASCCGAATCSAVCSACGKFQSRWVTTRCMLGVFTDENIAWQLG